MLGRHSLIAPSLLLPGGQSHTSLLEDQRRGRHNGAVSLKAVAAAHRRDPAYRERQRRHASQLGVVGEDWPYSPVIAHEAVELLGKRAAIVTQLLHGSCYKSDAHTAAEALEAENIKGKKWRVLIVGRGVSRVELHAHNRID